MPYFTSLKTLLLVTAALSIQIVSSSPLPSQPLALGDVSLPVSVPSPFCTKGGPNPVATPIPTVANRLAANSIPVRRGLSGAIPGSGGLLGPLDPIINNLPIIGNGNGNNGASYTPSGPYGGGGATPAPRPTPSKQPNPTPSAYYQAEPSVSKPPSAIESSSAPPSSTPGAGNGPLQGVDLGNVIPKAGGLDGLPVSAIVEVLAPVLSGGKGSGLGEGAGSKSKRMMTQRLAVDSRL